MKSKMSAPKRLQVLSLLTRLVTEGINACAKKILSLKMDRPLAWDMRITHPG